MTTPSQRPIQRLRLTYSKTGDARYIGHLDVARFWERVFRRVKLPLAYTQGYNPQPRIQFASALPVGVAGYNELVDILLTERLSPQDWLAPIARNLPAGFGIKALEEIPLKSPAMQALLRAAIYRACWQGLDEETVLRRVTDLLTQTEIIRPHSKKPHKHYNLRPRIHQISLTPSEQGYVCIRMNLQAGVLGNARVDEVIIALRLSHDRPSIVRERLIFEPIDQGENI